jgi:hypothetical protein
MARQTQSRRREPSSDSMEALKPLVVLMLFGVILYGAYSVVQKGPSSAPGPEGADAPAFAPPQVQFSGPDSAFATAAPAVPSPVAGPPPAPPTPPQDQPPFMSPVEIAGGGPEELAVDLPSAPPAAAPVAVAAPAVALDAADVTHLTAEPAPPPDAAADPRELGPSSSVTLPPDRYASLVPAELPPTPTAPFAPPAQGLPPSASGSGPAFAAAWQDAEEKLATGRWAEALAALSVWYDDPSLGLEESQRLEDLLGQLAGTVIYSPQDLVLPPHVVASGENLQDIAAPLGISWQLLAKINGIDHPDALVPGEHLKVIRGPFDAVVSISRRRLSLQINGNYAGSFPVSVGRQFLDRVGGSVPVVTVQRGGADPLGLPGGPPLRPAVILGDGLSIEAPDGGTADIPQHASLLVSGRDLAELVDIIGPGSRILVRQ